MLRFSLITILINLFACSHEPNSIWLKVKKDIVATNYDSLYLRSKVSTTLLADSINHNPKFFEPAFLYDLFQDLTSRTDYSIERNNDTTRVWFNPGKRIASGPIIYIAGPDSAWSIVDIVFGK